MRLLKSIYFKRTSKQSNKTIQCDIKRGPLPEMAVRGRMPYLKNIERKLKRYQEQ